MCFVHLFGAGNVLYGINGVYLSGYMCLVDEVATKVEKMSTEVKKRTCGFPYSIPKY